MEAQSSIVILLLKFEASRKGIIIDDHTGNSRIAIASRGIVFVLVEAAGSSPAPMSYTVNGRIKQDMLLCSMMPCIGSLRCVL